MRTIFANGIMMFQSSDTVNVGVDAEFAEIMWKHLAFFRSDGRFNEVRTSDFDGKNAPELCSAYAQSMWSSEFHIFTLEFYIGIFLQKWRPKDIRKKSNFTVMVDFRFHE